MKEEKSAQATVKDSKECFIRINQEWCKGCGICSAFCEKKVYEKDAYGHPVIVNLNLCNRCMKCVERCPEFAIEVDRLKRSGEKPGVKNTGKTEED